MDGSGYRPQREDPHDHHDHGVETDDRSSFAWLLILIAAALAGLFYLQKMH